MEIKKNDWKVWLILSTFGIEFREWHNVSKSEEAQYDRNYRRVKKWWQVTPQDICTFRKMFIISLIMLPVSYFGHIFNWLSKTKDASAGRAFLFLLVFYLITVMLCLPGTVEKPNGFDYQQQFCSTLIDKLIFYYVCAPLLVIAVGTICLALFVVACPFIWLYETYKTYNRNKREDKEWKKQKQDPKPESNNFIYAMYKSLKEKYCTKITYIE
jgi:hypothetical protein